MTDKPTDMAGILASVRQERLENAVDELMAAEEAGTLGKPREQPSRAEAREDSDDALQSEYEEATAPGLEDDQPPLVVTEPAVPPAVSMAAQVSVKAADMYLATRTGVPDAVTMSLKAVQNAGDVAGIEGGRAKAAAFVGGLGVDYAVQKSMPPGSVDPGMESLADDLKENVRTSAETWLGEPAAGDQGSGEQGPLIQ